MYSRSSGVMAPIIFRVGFGTAAAVAAATVVIRWFNPSGPVAGAGGGATESRDGALTRSARCGGKNKNGTTRKCGNLEKKKAENCYSKREGQMGGGREGD